MPYYYRPVIADTAVRPVGYQAMTQSGLRHRKGQRLTPKESDAILKTSPSGSKSSLRDYIIDCSSTVAVTLTCLKGKHSLSVSSVATPKEDKTFTGIIHQWRRHWLTLCHLWRLPWRARFVVSPCILFDRISWPWKRPTHALSGKVVHYRIQDECVWLDNNNRGSLYFPGLSTGAIPAL